MDPMLLFASMLYLQTAVFVALCCVLGTQGLVRAVYYVCTCNESKLICCCGKVICCISGFDLHIMKLV